MNKNVGAGAVSGKRALVVGQGSIGTRHARILEEDGAQVSAVSSWQPGAYRSVGEALASSRFDYVVVANETARHMQAVSQLSALGFDGIVLIEKPVAEGMASLEGAEGRAWPFRRVGVAYNLRFHPLIGALRAHLDGKRVLEARLHVGQYLPSWRSGSDFRKDSSARLAAGGGALRDLSHELDLANFLFGRWKGCFARGGNLGLLGIETDEAWSIIIETEAGAMLNITLNYYDMPAERRMTVTTAAGTVSIDLNEGTFYHNAMVNSFKTSRDFTYQAMHQALCRDEPGFFCSLESARGTLELIESIETSSRTNTWQTR